MNNKENYILWNMYYDEEDIKMKIGKLKILRMIER